jgi:L,D-transpeptidase ErfK/SrfK
MIERMTRRGFARTVLAAGAATVAGPLAASETVDASGGTVNRRISGLKTHDWREYFQSVDNDAILCVIDDRVLHYWGADGFYRIYPTSVALSDEMTRRGRTEIVAKRPEPEWRPTPSMLERNPALPEYVGPGPDNPLGVRAMNLGWQYYLIHGTNDIRKIGRQSSSGCIGLFNEHILEVYDRAKIGTPVMVI